MPMTAERQGATDRAIGRCALQPYAVHAATVGGARCNRRRCTLQLDVMGFRPKAYSLSP